MNKRWFAPIVLVALWLGLAGYGGPIFGKLESISSNDEATFLPRSAESTKVQALQTQFVGEQSLPAIVVFESNDPIAPSVIGSLAGLTVELGSIPGVEAAPATAPTSVIGPIPSRDGKAIQLIVPIANADEVATVVDEIRSEVKADTPAGTTAYVAGPAGFLADLTGAFGGIDGLLLLVSLLAVLVILIVVYRSIVLPFVVLLTAIFALSAAIIVIYLLGKAGIITLNGQSQGILSILVIGAATDYALLMVARFREALHHTSSRWQATVIAWKSAFEPVTASAATVAAALLCLLFSDLESNRGLGPVGAIGILAAWLASISFLPAVLALLGRVAFWPVRPQLTSITTKTDGITPFWQKVGHIVARRPRATWMITLGVLLLAAAAAPSFKASGVPETELLLTSSEAVSGQDALGRHFDAGTGTPVQIIAPSGQAEVVRVATAGTAGIAQADIYKDSAGLPVVKDSQVLINATLADAPDSTTAKTTIERLRTNLKSVDSAVLVGGRTAVAVDTNTTAQHDLKIIIPIVLIVILVILMILLRAIIAPILLIGTVVISYLATLGVSALVFNNILGHPGADPTVPLYGFVFLVALGIDYNIFLMTRVREEAQIHGTSTGIIRGLGKTGGVITSAGVVLAATFAALGVIPILFLVQLAFIVAFGVLLDTILVRSLLVPALSYDLGKFIWWPSRLARAVVPSKKQ